MKKFLVGAALAATLVGGLAIAQSGAFPGPGPRGMRWADANGDGMITRTEAISAVTAHFDKVDTNKDGKVTRDELDAARKAHRAARMARFGDRGDHPHGRHGMRPGGPGGPGRPGGMLADLDADRDGKLSRAEFDAPFARMDTNQDGFVDAAERQAMMQAFDAGHGRHGDRWDGKAPPPPAPPAHMLNPAPAAPQSPPSTTIGK